MSSMAPTANVPVVLRPKAAAPYMGECLAKFWERAKNDPDHPKTFKLGPRTTVVYVADCDAYLAKKRKQAQAGKADQEAGQGQAV